MYTDDKNAQVILALLKEYGIKKIVVSPGSTNVPISRSVQIDPWFEVYSVVDERSAAYFACGLAEASGEPVVISCTGATASRNYLSGLTEAFYRNLPVIALTSQHHTSDFGNLAPQVTDRTASQNDVRRISVNLPIVKDDEDLEHCVISANKALIAATTRGNGPVHINLHFGGHGFTTAKLPDVRKIQYYETTDLTDVIDELHAELSAKKVALFFGSHRSLTIEEKNVLEAFSAKYKAPVIIDHTSGYKGKRSILLSQIADIKQSIQKPELVIDLGSVTGDYSSVWLQGSPVWRLSEDKEIHDRFHGQTKLFAGSEFHFFETLSTGKPAKKDDYFAALASEVATITVPEDEMPLSNTYVSYQLSKTLPKESNLHLGILNSLRNMNFFKLDESISVSSNVGGFGIDGPLSTLIGQSMINRKKLTFGLLGDLAAFYDMNALGIRHISNNVRILVVNNNGGVEFRLNADLDTLWADDMNEFISAGGHNGSMKGWAESLGFEYISAESKDDFNEKVKIFTSPDITTFKRPVLFEVFTTIKDEQVGVGLVQNRNRPSHLQNVPELNVSNDFKNSLKKMTPQSVKKVYRKLKKHD